jgi:hypothetical protein
MTDPCTPLEERAAIIAEACGVSQAEGLRRARLQLSTPPPAANPTPSESPPRLGR